MSTKYKVIFLLVCIKTTCSFKFNNFTQDTSKSNSSQSEGHMKLQKDVEEDTRGVVMELADHFHEKQSYRLVSASTDLFDVNSSTGRVTLKNGQVLDYEDPSQRSIQLVIQARVLKTGALTNILLTILVTDVNDEAPDFKNKPYPFLATVGPNTPANQKVYELFAEDPDTNSSIVYNIDSGAEGRFVVRTEILTNIKGQVIKVGNIHTQGQGRFEENHEYHLVCSATDNAAMPVQKTFATVYVRVGFRPPQFYETNFKAFVRENNGLDQTLNNEFKIEAKSFQGHALSYKLRRTDNSTSTCFSIDADGTIKTQQLLDYESVSRQQRPPIYELNVFATEAVTNLQSSAKVFVEVLDDNDNIPMIVRSRYTATLPENYSVGSKVLELQARDDDSGVNGELVYSVDHENFAVNTSSTTTQDGMSQYLGTIYVKQPLDYDRLLGHFYSFTVTATDQGIPPTSSTTNVHVFITNVNDEHPEIFPYKPKMIVGEDANIGDVQNIVRAKDLDGDKVNFYFSPNRTRYEIFDIDPTTGVIRTVKEVPTNRDWYELKITAVDDGSCCAGNVRLSSEVTITAEITDTNNQMPSFPDCSRYSDTSIFEDEPIGTQVLWIQAMDDDHGQNGRVTYSIIENSDQSASKLHSFFNIGNVTGKLTSAVSFDRETRRSYSITVKGTDQGIPPLDGYCTFTVSIDDVNDNAPVFDQPRYNANISQDFRPGHSIITVRADDADLGNNADVIYSLVPSSDAAFFRIENEAGTIYLNKSLGQEGQLKIAVIATDTGNPPLQATTVVTITVTGSRTIVTGNTTDTSPHFTQTYNTSVREDAQIQQSVLSVSARDPDGSTLSYSIVGGNSQNSFGMKAKTGIIFVARQLDFETTQVYSLIIEVSDGSNCNNTTVTVHVLDANDNTPVFENDTYVVTDVVEEDNTITPASPRFLVKVSATDADIKRPTNIRYSLLGSGTQPPEKYFEINAQTGEVYLLTSLDRDLPNGRATYQFNVRAEDEMDPLPGPWTLDPPRYGYANVQVKPIDINDNAPIIGSNLTGSVKEHSPKGSPVMIDVAIDYDGGLNGEVLYKVTEGPTMGPDQGFMFKNMQPNEGFLLTNTDRPELDREVTPFYSIYLAASDQGRQPKTTVAAVSINIEDINDNVPFFEKPIYKIEISEALVYGSIARLRAIDNDIGENARIFYSLRDNLDFFSMETVNNTGVLSIFKPLDYENPSERFFNLTVVAQDPDPSHTAVAHVEVTVKDFNDNAPEFFKHFIEISELESAPVGSVLAQEVAIDYDSASNGMFEYSIDLNTDPRHLFSVDQTGNVTIRKMMDREIQDEHTVHILAIDKGVPAQTGTATLVIKVLDVNDNYPIFSKDYHPIVMENAKVYPALVQVIETVDKDKDPFGAPFGFAEPNCSNGTNVCPCDARPSCHDFSFVFNPTGDLGRGSGIVSTKRIFDREHQKLYYLPLLTWDMRGTGDPRSQTGTNTLTIEIGDVNDNKHSPGHKDILVYIYKGIPGSVDIGTVYAEDPDDWDVVDKTFTLTGPGTLDKYFSVDKDSGMISLETNIPIREESYKLGVDVYDRVWNLSVPCTVSVKVESLQDEASHSLGSMRIAGTTVEKFVAKSMTGSGAQSQFDKFRSFIANHQNVFLDPESVRVVNVQDNNGMVDVYFSVQSWWGFYSSSNANAVVLVNKDLLEKELGVQIVQVPVNTCPDELQHTGSCYNQLVVTHKPLLVNSNNTAVVGVEVSMKARYECRTGIFPPADKCSIGYCYNGGTCKLDLWGDAVCECLYGHEGPRCQGTHHSFEGHNYALYDPLEQCESSRTSLYFITEHEDGLILYNGPTADRPAGSEDPTDFISLELVSGYPRLRIDHGSGEVELYIDGRNSHGVAKVQKLSDGKWHRIDILRNGKKVEMIVDHCHQAETGPHALLLDDSMCRKAGRTPNDNKFLNVNTLLQLGGRFSQPNYPQGIMSANFNGCVKNFMHNGKLYDLTVSGNHSYPSGDNRCQLEDAICGDNLVTSLYQSQSTCGAHGYCDANLIQKTAKCFCQPGYKPDYNGQKCSTAATVKDLGTDSFIQFRLKDSFFNKVKSSSLKMQMMFRTRDTLGVLWTVTSNSEMFITLQIVNGRITVLYNMGGQNRTLQLYNRVASNGAWHSTTVERHGREFTLSMDNGEGPNYNFTYGYPDDELEFMIENTVTVGATVSFSNSVSSLSSKLEHTCIQDIRMDDKWFPLDSHEASQSSASDIMTASRVSNGCYRDDCHHAICPHGQVCVPMWGTYTCSCPDHFELSGSVCVPKDYCKNSKCLQGSTCVTDLTTDEKYACHCPADTSGQFCEHILPNKGNLQFDKANQSVIMPESQTSGIIASVWVTGNHSNIKYSIQNGRGHFGVTGMPYSALVRVIKPVDYEVPDQRSFQLVIVAEENRTGIMVTATTTVYVTVQDVNDNFPAFAQNYHLIVMENYLTFPELVGTVLGKDADSVLFGAPFGFRCANTSACADFTLKFDPAGDSGRGSVDVSTTRMYDREHQKLYYLPLLTWDMRGTRDPRSQTGTNTLTIEIGDVNDNKHSPGHKDIFVYTYQGLKYPLLLGNVYAEDLDDWDVVDKTFQFAGPQFMAKFFAINYNSGELTLIAPVPGRTSVSFSVDVTDNFWRSTVRSLVTVHFRSVNLQGIKSAVPFRFADITPEEFIWREKASGNISDYHLSKYDLFHQAVSKTVSSSVDHVDVFSLHAYGADTDVWVSIKGQGYNGTLLLNTTSFHDQLKVASQIGLTTVPLDSFRTPKTTGHSLLVNTNATSIVGVQLASLP